MKRIVILGGGAAGTIVANKLARAAAARDWRITVVDRDNEHVYQPGFLFIPFHRSEPVDLVRSRRRYLDRRVQLQLAVVTGIEPEHNLVYLDSGDVLPYDFLVIATGARPAPERVPGLLGPAWGVSIGEFYTLDGATKLQRTLESWPGGRLVVDVAETPVKYPLAPLEFALLADTFFRDQRMRLAVEIVYVTPDEWSFPHVEVARLLETLMSEHRVRFVREFPLARVDGAAKQLFDPQGRSERYDLLVVAPPHLGDPALRVSGLADERNFVRTDKHTLQAEAAANIFALGDATNVPALKTVSCSTFQADIVVANLLSLLAGQPPTARFDGHASCFVESGEGKAVLIDSSYDNEPAPAKFPLPGVGPWSILKETRLNHWGNVMLKWAYWNMLLPGRPLPLTPEPTTAPVPMEVS